MTPQEFVDRWKNTELGERQSYQMHFRDVCDLVGYGSHPIGSNEEGDTFVFEYSLKKDSGGQGYADVYLQGHFAVEYKAPGKYPDLKAAYNQLLQYREQLQNPPLLVVTDIQNWEIHTNWPNTEKRVYSFTHEEIATRQTVRDILHNLFYSPAALHPSRNTDQVTTDAANAFRMIADNMRAWEADPERIAHFLTKLVFCLFAEDVHLLPSGPTGEHGIFSDIIERTRTKPEDFVQTTEYLFRAMADGGRIPFVNIDIPYFNGSLFDDVRVETLSLEALTALWNAGKLNWQSVEPSIFGTLFERSLDPDKRSQLGAHYTSREDILLIVNPVLMQPLEREWARIQAEAEPIRAKYDDALRDSRTTSNRRMLTTYEKQLNALRENMLACLRDVKVLDPACGSGNFLYVSLQRLMDMEKEVINHPLFAGLSKPMPEVHPRQMYGIEINPIAHALASIVVWIGWLQWRIQNGYAQGWSEPILEDLHGNIVCKDAILAHDADGSPTEPDWPAVDVIVGNPPFLGNRKMRPELGDVYVDSLLETYKDSFGNLTLDLVCYWHEKGRKQIEKRVAKRVGLLATNSIRGGTNRVVLQNIVDSGQIFMAWSDREWILEGAAVRVSMVGFDDGSEKAITLDGELVARINPDLTDEVDLSVAKQLIECVDIAFQGVNKRGPFDIPGKLAYEIISMSNPDSQHLNADVVKRIYNGLDITRRPRDYWIIDFGVSTTEDEAKKYVAPYEYLKEHVKPMRAKTKQAVSRELWWLHWNTRPTMRGKLQLVDRYIVTARVAKHRLFMWLEKSILPDVQLIAIARDDDYFFGVLHSRLHEVWSLRMGTWLGKGNDPRYTPTTTFETFPFPWSPGQEDTASAAYQAISAAAQQLHEERDAWLNPPGVSNSALKDRTLTNLYNALNVLRGKEAIKIKQAAGDFAPRLDELHQTLDEAVCAAYGWPTSVLSDDEDLLARLLALNLQRAGQQS
ncbi:MAG: class I SAM-dependent DNA methyltransferase [Anaerolineae bacterium]|nr:class I SAM-dependent DNA methyltransferase [Anaerolineae bacterium]